MSQASKDNRKGHLILGVINSLAKDMDTLLDLEILNNLLRNILDIFLLRSEKQIFRETSSGAVAVTLLNTPDYQTLARCINQNSEKITYGKVMKFVTGIEEDKYFDAQHASAVYKYFEEKIRQ